MTAAAILLAAVAGIAVLRVHREHGLEVRLRLGGPALAQAAAALELAQGRVARLTLQGRRNPISLVSQNYQDRVRPRLGKLLRLFLGSRNG